MKSKKEEKKKGMYAMKRYNGLYKITFEVSTDKGKRTVILGCDNDAYFSVLSINIKLKKQDSEDTEFRIKELVIPESFTINGEDFKISGFHKVAIDSNVFIESLVLSDNIVHVENGSFTYEHVWIKGSTRPGSVRTVRWPSHIKLIDQQFSNCVTLRSVTNVDAVDQIRRDAFLGTGLEAFDWPIGCHIIPQACFKNCGNLKHVTIRPEVGHLLVQPGAFKGTAIETLDLSNLPYCEFHKDAVDEGVKVLMPFHGKITNN